VAIEATGGSTLRDVGVLHIRLAAGFVADTRMEGNVRVVTFGNGMVVREDMSPGSSGLPTCCTMMEAGVTAINKTIEAG
jgi:hypothetical protein